MAKSDKQFGILPTKGITFNQKDGSVVLNPFPFDVKNFNGQIWRKTAVTKTISEHAFVTLYNAHSPKGDIVGKVNLKIVGNGLGGEGKILNVKAAEDTLELMSEGILGAWSPGFYILQANYNSKDNADELLEVSIDEVALLPIGTAANRDATAYLLNERSRLLQGEPLIQHSRDAEPGIHSNAWADILTDMRQFNKFLEGFKDGNREKTF